MSNEMGVRISHPGSLRVPGEGSSAQGKPEPKVNPKGVADGKRVKNPVLVYNEIQGVTQEAKLSSQSCKTSKR